MRVSSVGTPVTLSDMPVPRLSKWISREKDPSRSNIALNAGTCQASST
ncbi:MAG: hypothetical protein HW413_1331 [Thermoleophilia bacterium]|nr:hypothetical protein [Thermoleophilia bacterium]